MKRKSFLISSLFFLLLACTNSDEKTKESVKSENDIDAARNFIHSVLTGDLNKARSFMLRDSANDQWMDAYERSYNKFSQDDKTGYRNASIIVHKIINPNDSTTIVIYSNSYKKNPDTMKVVKQNGLWLVDLKYIFIHENDTIFKHQIKKSTQ